jgi:hypothetical protein
VAGAVIGAAFVVFTGLALWGIFHYRMTVDFPVTSNLLVALFAFAMGITVWGGEKLFEQGHMTTLPVRRQDHILIRTLAGGVWLFGIVAWILLWVAAMGLISGSDLGFDRYMLTGPVGPEGQVAFDAVEKFRWTPRTWHWLAPFTTAAVFYLLGSAMTVAAKTWWLWAIVGTVVIILAAIDPTGTSERIIQALIGDPLGLDNLLTGGLERADMGLVLPDGKQIVAWSHAPSAQAWAIATAAWLALAGGLLWLAAWRHREG